MINIWSIFKFEYQKILCLQTKKKGDDYNFILQDFNKDKMVKLLEYAGSNLTPSISMVFCPIHACKYFCRSKSCHICVYTTANAEIDCKWSGVIGLFPRPK